LAFPGPIDLRPHHQDGIDLPLGSFAGIPVSVDRNPIDVIDIADPLVLSSGIEVSCELALSRLGNISHWLNQYDLSMLSKLRNERVGL
jgi:hypothetical protein